MKTPWGKSDSEKQYADGIVFYTTPSHGGFKLSLERNAKINLLAFKNPYWGKQRQDGWYEEDCDWAFVAVTFPEIFGVETVRNAELSIKAFWPDLAKELNLMAKEK